MNFEFLKITEQRFEPGNLGSESKCSSTAPRWDLYVESGDTVVNSKGRANEIGQSWCPADLLDFQLPTTGTSQRPPILGSGTPSLLCTRPYLRHFVRCKHHHRYH